ncbi:MAG: purine-nucleoside phosphorylase, partial [Planctomycetales bacterium]|nr:purine-nucleoside phosphorylase [Planctomycetales bacterium]
MTVEEDQSDASNVSVDAVNVAVADIKNRIGWRETAVDDGVVQKFTAIVLGSGLGSLADKIQSPIEIPFAQIRGFARSTAGGHRGQLIVGYLEGARVVAMAGRLHRYEGWTNRQVTFPIRVMHALGANRLIASNAAGGVNPRLRVGDIVVIKDHIDWLHPTRRTRQTSHRRSAFGGSALQGESILGEPILGEPILRGTDEFLVRRNGNVYDSAMASQGLAAARDGGFTAIEGTYLATLGPTYETRAEYRMMRRMGADVVGMSTVGEVLVAADLGMTVLALSVVSNVADPDRANVADHAE